MENIEDFEDFDESTYVMPDYEKAEVNENIKKRPRSSLVTHNRIQPKKPQTEAQKAVFVKARAKLIENREARKAHKAIPKAIPKPIAQSEPKAKPVKRSIDTVPTRSELLMEQAHDVVYDDEYEDKEGGKHFMIGNNDDNYIVKQVVKRHIATPKHIAKHRKISKKTIEDNIDQNKLDNIVETQINSIEKSQAKPPYKNTHNHTNIHHHVNVHKHVDIVNNAKAPKKINRKALTLLDLND